MLSVIIGAVLGTAVGVLNFRMLVRITEKIARPNAGNGGGLAIGGMLLHGAVYVALVAAAVLIEQISILGVGAGLILSSLINLRSSAGRPRKKCKECTEEERQEQNV